MSSWVFQVAAPNEVEVLGVRSHDKKSGVPSAVTRDTGYPFGARTRRQEMTSEDRARLGTSRWPFG